MSGSPAANPYLYIASQLITGLDGLDNKREPGPPDTDPYTTTAHHAAEDIPDSPRIVRERAAFTKEFGKIFVDYYVKIKRTELQRYENYAKDHNIDPASEATTEWEQNEYFDFF